MRAATLYPLPGASPELLGLAEVGGEPTPVLDLARLIQAPQGGIPAFPVHIVADIGSAGRKERVALAADAALTIAVIAPSEVAGPAAGLVQGEGMAGGHPTRLLNLEALEHE
jgi:chemotaxis signal transduction protein